MLKKHEFVSIIENLRDQVDYEAKRSKLLSEVYGNDVSLTDNSRLFNQIFKLLHKFFPPVDHFCPIQCFCFDMDFRRNTPNSIELLWDELQFQKEQNYPIDYKVIRNQNGES